MKNSAHYARKIKRIISGARRSAAPDRADRIRLLVSAVLQEDATAKQAADALKALEEEFVDFNELRVSPVKDIVECLGRGFPRARAKAASVTHALNAVFDETNALSLEYLDKKPKREVRAALREKLGLSPYAESVLTLYGFEGHAMPVDDLLLEALKLDGYIHPGSDLLDLQGFLERIVLNKDATGSHETLRAYVSKAAARVGREFARRARAAEKARAEAEAALAREEAAKAKEEADKVAAAAKAEKKPAAPKPKRKRAARPKRTKKVRRIGKAAKAKKAGRPGKSRKPGRAAITRAHK